MAISWTDRVNLEAQIISADAGEVPFNAWWDQLVGLSSRLLNLEVERHHIHQQLAALKTGYDPKQPGTFISPAQFFEYHKAIAERAQARGSLSASLSEINGAIDELTDDIFGLVADTKSRFALRIGEQDYIVETCWSLGKRLVNITRISVSVTNTDSIDSY